MATLEMILEAERRGILPPDKKILLDEARRRGIVPAAEGATQMPSPPLYLGDNGQALNPDEVEALYQRQPKLEPSVVGLAGKAISEQQNPMLNVAASPIAAINQISSALSSAGPEAVKQS